MKKFASVLLVVFVLLVVSVPVALAQAPAPVHAGVQVAAQVDVPPSDGVDGFADFIELFKESFPAGGFLALAVLAFVYIARVNGLVINGNWARIANVTLSTILSGLDPLNPNAEQGLVMVIATLGSGLLFELIQLGSKRLEEQKKASEAKK